MHLVFFNRSFYPDMAATGQLLTELCEGLATQYGFQVSVVAGLPYHPQNTEFKARFPLAREQHNGIRILRSHSTTLPKEKAVCRFTNYISYFLSSLMAGFYLRKPDIIVSLTDPPIIGLVGLLWARIYGAKFVFWCQDIFPEVALLLEDFRNDSLNRVLDKINRFLLGKADKVIAIGETMHRRLVEIKKAPEKKIQVIHNWADCGQILPINGPNRFRSEHGLNDKFVVMHSGNIGVSQDMEKIIESAKILRQKEDIVFLIIGEGNKKTELERKVKEWGLDNVIFLPYQPKEILKYSFSAADLFIISLKKGLAGYIVPSKLYGILASGRPFIAAVETECEVAKISKLYNCGVVCPPEDPYALASTIVQLYENPSNLKIMGKRAREAARNYDRKVALKSFYNLFSELPSSR
ncbi:MAG: glycosyltransferase family 4 protein [Candidatus Hodarchaeota archaeon]